MSIAEVVPPTDATAELAKPSDERVPHRFGVIRRALLTLAVTFAVILSGATIAAPAADASTVRAGARFGQVDILLDGVETQRAASSYWGAQSVCWSVTGAGWAALGIPGAVLGNLSCTSVVAVCAAQAYHAGRWAGMTVYPGGFFCWKY